MTVPDYDGFAAGVAPLLLRDAYLLTGDHHQAQDLVQESLLRLYVAWGRAGEWDSPQAYARTVVYRTFCSWRGRRWTGEQALGTVPETTVAVPDEPDEELRGALLLLPRRQRAVLVARFYLDLDVAATAELLGCGVGTVKSQTSRGLATLRTLLAGDPERTGGRR
jgi:RNA polymerase sigma-70 factor (sigma-E family)